MLGRKQITITVSSKCLELIDEYKKTTGLGVRSRVVEEAIFSINDLLKDEDMLASTLDRFRRFPIDEQNPESTPKKYRRKKYRKATSEEPNKKPKRRVRWE